MTGRIDTCVWWQVFPLGFTGAPPVIDDQSGPCRGLRSLIDWLDYAVELGANGLFLNPVFTAQTHGYDSIDQFSIDPRLGSMDDFDALVAACRQRGIRVMLDGVFNHVGSEHPWLKQALAEGPNGQYADFFAITWHDDGTPELDVFEGHGSLGELNHANPKVADYVVDVMNFWLDRGADAWRLDAAYSVPASFWAAVLPRVRERHPDVWVLGEVIHAPFDTYVAESGLDSITQYALWKAVWSSLKDENFFELDWALTQHRDLVTHFIPQTFIGNHDVTRIATQTGSAAKAVLAFTIEATVAGVPSVYYGDEQGYTGTKYERFGGDDEIRPVFPAHPEDLSTLGEPVWNAYKALISLRRRHPWLVSALTETTHLTNDRIVYVSRAPDGDDLISVELDVSADPTAVIRDGAGTVLWTWGDVALEK